VTTFSVKGPFKVPYHQAKAGRTIRDNEVKAFWSKHKGLAGERGCYVFGMRASRGLTPGYVGIATKGFKGETFTPHKVSKYQQFLADYQKGTPVLFFVVAPRRKGAPNKDHMKQLEDFLIQVGVATNPNLLNVRGTKSAEWGINCAFRRKWPRVPAESDHAFRLKAAARWAGAKRRRGIAHLLFFAAVFVSADKPSKGLFCLRIDSPFSVIVWALWTSRSRMASARVGSPRYSCQWVTGN